MDQNKDMFTEIQTDAIGEILNISMGSAATSISEMLSKRVLITTPKVSVVSAEDLHFEPLEPAIAVQITYVNGLFGTNIMILKKSDVKKIVEVLLCQEIPDEEFELDEMNLSAICEVMNQMMGASATALSQFLGRSINISTPETFPIEDSQAFRKEHYGEASQLVSVNFRFNVEGLIDSEFISVLPADLAEELITMFEDGFNDEEDEVNLPLEEIVAPPVSQAPIMYEEPSLPPSPTPTVTQQKKEVPQDTYNVRQASFQRFDNEVSSLSNEQTNNLNLIMSVPLQITVEIGRVQKQIKDILQFTEGSIIELDKQAGAQVDIYVNGQPIAKGDVVVIEEYYGVRINEILSTSEIMKVL